MTNTEDKSKVISSILKLARKTSNSATFDSLCDRETTYLVKLLNVVKNLKRVK